MTASSPDLDLDQLCREAADWLSRFPTTADGRVQDRPDARTVRYYQSIGLVDRPLRYDGRSARYGRRHLVQVVAVKVLQAQGYSLAQLQQRLSGVSTAALEAALDGSKPASAPSPTLTTLVPLPGRVGFLLAPGVEVWLDPSVVNIDDWTLKLSAFQKLNRGER